MGPANPIVVWTLLAVFLGSIVLAAWAGAMLSKNPRIKAFFNTRLGALVVVCTAFTGFLAAVAGASVDPPRFLLIACGIVFYSFFMSVGIYSENPVGYGRKPKA